MNKRVPDLLLIFAACLIAGTFIILDKNTSSILLLNEIILTIVFTLSIFIVLRAIRRISFFNREHSSEQIDKLKKELTQSKQQLETIFNKLDLFIWYFELNSKKLSVTAGSTKIFGYTYEAFSDINQWNELVYEQDLYLKEEYIEKLMQGQSSTVEIRILDKMGEIRWVECGGNPVFDSKKNMVGIKGIVMDITEKKLVEEELERECHLLENILNTVDAAVWSYDNTIRLMPYTSKGIKKITGYPSDKFIDRNSWVNIIHPEDLSTFEMLSANLRQGIPDKSEYRIIDATGDIRWVENRIVPTFDEINKLTRLDGVIIDITPRKMLEKEIAENELKWCLIARNMTDIVGVLDIQGIIKYASKRVLGHKDADIVGTFGLDYIHPEDFGFVKREFLEIINTKTNKLLQFRFNHADGYPLYIECMVTPVLGEDDEIQEIITVSRDVTERVSMEAKLKESEERYRRLIKLNPQPTAMVRDGKIIYINSAGLDLLAANHSTEVIGKQMYELIHQDYESKVETWFQSLGNIKCSEMKSIEAKVFRIDGEIIETEASGIYDDKTQSTLVVFNDITERKRIESALQDSEERYRKLVELSPVGISVYNDDSFIFANRAALNIIGATRVEDVIGTAPLDWVHRNDKDVASELLEETLLNGLSSSEHRIVRLDGRVVDVAVTAAIYDSKSSSVQLIFEDITQRKQAERDLLESEELNRRLVEFSPEAIVFHSDSKFILLNPAGLELFGASSLEEMIDQSILNFVHPEFQDLTTSRLEQVYKQKQTTSLSEIKLVRIDRTIIDAEVIVTPVPYMGMNAGLCLLRDITNRKKAEEDRDRAEQRIRESKERYFQLQTSLDHFSNDLFGVMKVSELERRLVKEVEKITKSTKISVLEIDESNEVIIKSGNRQVPKKLLEEISNTNLRLLPVCDIKETIDGYFVMIGEIRGKSYMLCIGEKSNSLKFTANKVWLKTISRYVSVLYDNFRLIEDLTQELEQIASGQKTPSWILRLLFRLSEKERKNLSQDLHDSALQEQIIWYRHLDQLSTEEYVPPVIQKQLEQITEGLLNVIYQIRITCNELRPPMLKEEGLVSSLEPLFELTQLRSNYSIEFDASRFQHNLNDDLLIGLYRIIQELLANATKHSNATKVHIKLVSNLDCIQLIYKDNGIGIDVSSLEEDSFKSMGVYGMKERVLSLNGKFRFQSTLSKGLLIDFSIPFGCLHHPDIFSTQGELE